MLQRFHFHRFEFKYLIFPETAAQIERELSFHMDPDAFAIHSPQRSYRVTSLYFDTDALDHYYEKLDGIKTRKKYRIRTYEESPREGMEVFLEIKRRKNNVVIKDRANVPFEVVRLSRLGKLWDMLGREDGIPPQRRQTLEEFLFDTHRLRMSPQVLVSYIRRPLVDRISRKVRVTFDREIRSLATDRLFSTERGRFIFTDHVVMEIKFSGSLPWWLHHIIQKYELSLRSISKYCLGLEATGRIDGGNKFVGYLRNYQWSNQKVLTQ